jgi:hypothetical protein
MQLLEWVFAPWTMVAQPLGSGADGWGRDVAQTPEAMAREAASLERVEARLACDPAPIPTEEEVTLLVSHRLARMPPPHARDPVAWEAADESVRWHAVGRRCEAARLARGLDERAAARALKVRQDLVGFIESGFVDEFPPGLAARYVTWLGIDAWVRCWARANPELAARAGLKPDDTP